MDKLTEIKTLVQRHHDMDEAMKQARKEMAEQALALLKEYKIKQIGLWSEDWTVGNEFERNPKYKDEDAELFNTLIPDFAPELWFGGDRNQYEGKIIAIRNAKGVLQFVCASDMYDEICLFNVLDYVNCPEEIKIDFCGVMDAFVKSAEFNVQHNIPVKKWVITHYPPANPYSDKYLSYKG